MLIDQSTAAVGMKSPEGTLGADDRSPPRLLIVGNGMASYGLVRELVRLQAAAKWSVTILGEEPRPAYDRVRLSDFFAGRTPQQMELASREWYASHGVELVTSCRATELDRTARRVVTNQGRHFQYDKCVLATGSRPFVPPIRGYDLPRVFVYRTIEDLQAIEAAAADCQTAAVLGGGLLGLEAAKALLDLRLTTHIVEMAPGLMPRQLDRASADLLKQKIEVLGIQVHLLRRTQAIQQAGAGLRLQYHDGSSLDVDMIVISAGIRPRDELANAAGLTLGARGGVAVNDRLQTDDPRVYAIGECAAVNDHVYGLVAPCYRMAEVLARNLAAIAAGDEALERFFGASEAARLKLLGVDVTTLGCTIGEHADGDMVARQVNGSCRTLMFKDRRVVGAIGVGEWPERDRVSRCIDRGKRLSRRQIRRFETAAQIWPDQLAESVHRWPRDAVVCSCMGVCRGALGDAMDAGVGDVAGLSEATCAATVCGSCRPLLAELLGEAPTPLASPGRRLLLAASLVAVVALVSIVLSGPIPFSASIASGWRRLDALWRDSVVKQVTGFALLGLSAAGLLVSLRKRWSGLQWGEFGWWRAMHGAVGAATLLGFVVHTGMHMGSNFTFALATVFLVLNLLGAATGVVAALESSVAGRTARHVRSWRPRLTRLHIWLFWPLPVLLLFHVISVYYY